MSWILLEKFPSVSGWLFVFASIHPPLNGIDLHQKKNKNSWLRILTITIQIFLSMHVKNCMCPHSTGIYVRSIWCSANGFYLCVCTRMFLLEPLRSTSNQPIWLLAKFPAVFSHSPSLSLPLALSPLSLESVINIIFGCSQHVIASIFSHADSAFAPAPDTHTYSCSQKQEHNR